MTSDAATKTLRFQYWSDPLCIWAYVAQDKLDRILSEWSEHLDVEYRIVPVFGSVPERFASGSWSASGPEGRRDATARVARTHGHEGVSGAFWVDDAPASSWSSGAAAKAAFIMESAGEIETGLAAKYLLTLRQHAFRHNVNISRRAAQLAAADEAGVPRERLARMLDDGEALAALSVDAEERVSLGLRGSPTYVFDGGRAVLYGNFPFEILHATVAELLRGVGVGASHC